MTREFTKEDISAYVMRRLGEPVMPVELTPEMLDDAIEDALEEYNRQLPVIKIGTIPIGSQGYSTDPLADLKLSNDTVTWYLDNKVNRSLRYTLRKVGRGIFEVSTGTRDELIDWSHSFGFPIPIEERGYMYTFDRYEAYLMWIEETRRVTSSEFEWRWVEPHLYLTNVPAQAERVFYSYWDDRGLEEIPTSWRKWIRDYAVAVSKSTLARIRGKYQSIPSPGGGVQMDAQDLQSQSEMEMEKLLEKLSNSRGDFLPPTWG